MKSAEPVPLPGADHRAHHGSHRNARKTLRILLAAALCGVLGFAGGTLMPGPGAAVTVEKRLRAAIRDLPVVAENRAGYDRDLFRHWIDANADCQDTRDEVLDAESRVDATGCDIESGNWFSYYDRRTFTDSSAVDIDHVVALAEAWDSGARRWTADTRQRYANDLGDARSLVAVSASSNRSKSDQDPAEWLPEFGRCTYVRHWVAVKVRWSLTVNAVEKQALSRVASGCTNTVLRVTKARVVLSSTSGGTAGGGGDGLDPHFATCTDAKAAGYGPYYQGRDPEYDWYRDGDSDGIACE